MNGRRVPTFSLFVLLVLVALGLSQAAQATTAALAPNPAVQLPWNSPAYRDCDQSCLYKKANENLSLQALYSVKKLQELEHASAAEKLANLRHFCVDNEHPNACFERFRDFTLLRLKRMQGALGRNGAAAAALNEERGGTVVVARGPDQVLNPVTRQFEERRRQAHAPHIPTFEELQAQREREVEMLPSLGTEPTEWNGRLQHAPDRSDYVMYRQIPRDPSQPNGEQLLVPDRSCGADVCYDDQAFRAAQQAFEERRDHFEVRSQFYRRFQQVPAQIAALPELDQDSEGEISIQAYNDARGAMVDTANQVIAGDASGSSRGLAASVGPTAPGTSATTAAAGSPASATGSVEPTATSGGSAAHYTGREQVLPRQAGPNVKDIYVTFAPEDLGSVLQGLETSGLGLGGSAGTGGSGTAGMGGAGGSGTSVGAGGPVTAPVTIDSPATTAPDADVAAANP